MQRKTQFHVHKFSVAYKKILLLVQILNTVFRNLCIIFRKRLRYFKIQKKGPFVSVTSFQRNMSGTIKFRSVCYEIAEGFRFMPLSLVRLRTFRLSTWVVGCKIEAGVNAGARERMEVSLRCHNSPRRYWLTRCGWRHAPEARGSLCENLKKIRVGFWTPNKKDQFCSSQARGELAPYGEPLELEARWIRQDRRLCLSPLCRNL